MTQERGAEQGFVSFRNVNKAYAALTVIRDLNLDVARGEFLTLLGPSGSGKTTSLMMLAGFEHPTSGTISLDGRVISNVPPHRRGIGVVFQNYALFPHMSILDNIKYPLRARGMRSRDCTQDAMRALAMVRLEALAHRTPAQLSGGQQQRVAVARALVFKPSLVLMDEPLGALDKQLREQLQDEIKSIHRETGVTVVYVTHDQSEALTMSDRVAVFDKGRIAQISTPAELYKSPLSSFVASFLGESNLLDAELLDGGPGGNTIRLADGSVRTVPGREIARPAAVQLLVRPEHLELSSPSQGEGYVALIRDFAYHGDHLRVKVFNPTLGTLIAKLQVGSTQDLPCIGGETLVHWRDSDSVVVRRVGDDEA
ncbi:Spermidine/putrescine import ATP-binding protein PotA [Starkeya nomas]|uniref:Spermidine/putrescine import ATP-binding protein PotA n=1 Tax=Starkeya nomas TaxID=2666134 RepID=A0A5S9PU94_9HYPH|nr:ABC transporter ATP-binding protein [Starkeya nomas]CAA0108343.1 Spermidine/putrescine import ATP-binding protein PotA [Starkeya nomas]